MKQKEKDKIEKNLLYLLFTEIKDFETIRGIQTHYNEIFDTNYSYGIIKRRLESLFKNALIAKKELNYKIGNNDLIILYGMEK